MNLYLVIYDGQHFYVEAKNFAQAIELWTEHVKEVWGDDFDGTEQPESCAHIHDEAVIRHIEKPAHLLAHLA